MASKVKGDTNLSIDKKLVFDVDVKDLKVLAVYSNNPSDFLALIKAHDHINAVLRFFEYADSSFMDKCKPFLDSGTLKCVLFFDRLNEMGIEDAYQKIKADLSKKGLINGGESLVLLNTGFAGIPNIGSFIMVIGVMVIADNKSTINVVSADNIQKGKVKFNIKR